MTELVHADDSAIARAGELIRAGELVAFPTETVYGLGANALSAEAVAKIFTAKGRPPTDPIILHIAQEDSLEQIAQEVPPLVKTLAERFWPGPLTLIMPRAAAVPDNVAAGLPTIAVRMPAHPVALALIEAAGVPIAAPSANTFTRPSPTRAAHVMQDLNGKLALVLDAGETSIGVESTVLSLMDTPPKILRPGGVTLEDLRPIIPTVVMNPAYLNLNNAAAPAPGQLTKHYSPNAEVLLFTGAGALAEMRHTAQAHLAAGRKVGAMLLHADQEAFGVKDVQTIEMGHNLTEFSLRLYAALRELDAQAVDVILVRDVGRVGLGAAVWDRLLRAAEGRVIET